VTLSGDIIVAPSVAGDVNISYCYYVNGAFIVENTPLLTTLTLQQVCTPGRTSARDFVSTDFSGKSTALIEGIPNVDRPTFRYMERKSVTISGNGNLPALFSCSGYKSAIIIDCPFHNRGRILPGTSMHVPNLTMSGVSNLTRDNDQSPADSIIMGILRAINNTFTTLTLGFENLTRLYLVDNPHLREVRF
jgi:hypothetical protein